jgi:glycosyltransferase involved in cell wall biosynthesis
VSGRERPRVLLLTSALDAVGGIPSYSRALLTALSASCDVRVKDLSLSGGLADQIRGFVQALRSLAGTRPDLLVLGHVGLGPIGLVWRLLGGRYAVVAYGIEVWATPSARDERSLRSASAVWPISSWTATEVLRTAPGSTVDRPLGGNIAERFFQPHEVVNGPFRVLYVGQLTDLAYKGVDTLVRAGLAAAEARPIEVRIAGTGTRLDALRQFVAEHDTRGVVRILGPLDDDALLAEYRRAGVIVLASRFRRGVNPQGEGLGLVVLEAAAAGTPAAVADRGGSVDTIIPGETGFAVAAGSPRELAMVLGKMADNPQEARRMGERAREFVRHGHSLEAFTGRVGQSVRRALR